MCVCVCYYCMCVLHVCKSDADACILQTPRWSWKLTELTAWTVTRKMYKRVKGRNFQAYPRRRGWTTVVRMMMMDLNWLNPSHFHFKTFAGSSLFKIAQLMEWSKRALVMKVTQKKSHMGSFIQEMDWHGVHYFLLGLGVAWRQKLSTKSLPHKSPTLHLCLIQLTVSNLFFLMTSLMSLWENTNIEGKRMKQNWRETDAVEIQALIGSLLIIGTLKQNVWHRHHLGFFLWQPYGMGWNGLH